MFIRKNTLLFHAFFVIFLFSPYYGSAQKIIHLPTPRYDFKGLKLESSVSTAHPKIGLVLSGGGARGLSQIGVLRALEKHNIPIDFIVGNSMGSVIGGLYASGYSTAALESIATQTDWEELLSFTEGTERNELFVRQKQEDQVGYLTIRFDGLQPIIPSSVSSGQHLINYFVTLTMQALYHPDSTFDELKIPFRATAVDLITGRRAVLSKGSLAEAMRSSITVPLLYTPLERDSMALVDGGLISNIPVDVADSAGCDIIIAVNSTSGLRHPDQMQAPWEIADQIMTIIMQAPNKSQLAKADVVISPDDTDRLVSDFHDVTSVIDAGERAAEPLCAKILNLMKERKGDTYIFPDSTLGNEQVSVQGSYITRNDREEITSLVQNNSSSVHQIENCLSAINKSGKYRDVNAELSQSDPPTVTYHVTAYPIIQRVEFSGNTVISTESIRSVVGELESNVLNYNRIQKTLESVLSLYRDEQYSLARVTHVQIDPDSGVVRFRINEGILHDVVCDGNASTKDYVIRREFPWQYGDIFNMSKANTGLLNIASTGLFEYILMDVRYADNEPTIAIKVKEKSPEFIRLGLHADNEHDLVGTIEFRDANFRGAGEDVSLLTRYGFRDRIVRAEYRADRIFNTYLTFDFRGYLNSRDVITYRDGNTNSLTHWERTENGRYRQTRLGGSFTFGSQLARLGDVTAELRTERQRIAGISGAGYDNADYRFVGLKIQTTLDTEDKFVFPMEGFYFSLSYESALRGLGSEVSFTKISAMWQVYHTLFNHHTIHTRVEFGFADQTLPLAEQYSLGGMNSFYGLQEDDSRGRQLFVGSFEYRLELPFKILFKTYVSARYDLGTISPLPEELKINEFHHGIGLQLGLDTPLGEVSVAAGKSFLFLRAIKNSPISSGPVQIYFSIGPSL